MWLLKTGGSLIEVTVYRVLTVYIPQICYNRNCKQPFSRKAEKYIHASNLQPMKCEMKCFIGL